MGRAFAPHPGKVFGEMAFKEFQAQTDFQSRLHENHWIPIQFHAKSMISMNIDQQYISFRESPRSLAEEPTNSASPVLTWPRTWTSAKTSTSSSWTCGPHPSRLDFTQFAWFSEVGHCARSFSGRPLRAHTSSALNARAKFNTKRCRRSAVKKKVNYYSPNYAEDLLKKLEE